VNEAIQKMTYGISTYFCCTDEGWREEQEAVRMRGKKDSQERHRLEEGDEEDDENEVILQTKQINYKKTYFEIDFNVHLMDMVCALRPSYGEKFTVANCADCYLRPELGTVAMYGAFNFRLPVLSHLGILIMFMALEGLPDSLQPSTRT
jgi:hypothetical protein